MRCVSLVGHSRSQCGILADVCPQSSQPWESRSPVSQEGCSVRVCSQVLPHLTSVCVSISFLYVQAWLKSSELSPKLRSMETNTNRLCRQTEADTPKQEALSNLSLRSKQRWKWKPQARCPNWRSFQPKCSVSWLSFLDKYNQSSYFAPQTFLSGKSRIKHKQVSVLFIYTGRLITMQVLF